MENHPISKTVGLVTGTAGATFPFWNEALIWLTGLNQTAVAILGLIVLILTARKIWLENKINSRRLRDLEKGDE